MTNQGPDAKSTFAIPNQGPASYGSIEARPVDAPPTTEVELLTDQARQFAYPAFRSFEWQDAPQISTTEARSERVFADPKIARMVEIGNELELLRSLDTANTVNNLWGALVAIRKTLFRTQTGIRDVAAARRRDQIEQESVIGASIWGATIPAGEEWRFHYEPQDGRHEATFARWQKANPAKVDIIRYVIQPKSDLIPGASSDLGVRKVVAGAFGMRAEMLDETSFDGGQEIDVLLLALETYLSRVQRQLYPDKQ